MCEVVALVYGNNQRSAAAITADRTQSVATPSSRTSTTHRGALPRRARCTRSCCSDTHDTGFTEADIGEVAVAQRLHSSLNPNAIMQKRVTIEEYLATPYVTEPLHLLDYCLINDGGVAFILMSAERARRGSRKPAVIHGIGRHDLSREATSLVPRLTDFYRPAQGKVAQQVFNMAGVGPKDIDVSKSTTASPSTSRWRSRAMATARRGGGAFLPGHRHSLERGCRSIPRAAISARATCRAGTIRSRRCARSGANAATAGAGLQICPLFLRRGRQGAVDHLRPLIAADMGRADDPL